MTRAVKKRVGSKNASKDQKDQGTRWENGRDDTGGVGKLDGQVGEGVLGGRERVGEIMIGDQYVILRQKEARTR